MTELQFTRDDIVERLLQICDLPESDGKYWRSHFAHELTTDFFIAEHNFSLFRRRSGTPTIHQLAYASNVCNGTRLSTHYLSNALRATRDDRSKTKSEIKSAAGSLHFELKALLPFLPLTERILELGPLAHEKEKYLRRMNQSMEFGIYSYNLVFAPDAEKSSRDLKRDLNHFRDNISETVGIRFNVAGDLPHIVTTDDYLQSAIVPLVKNARQHAFEPSRDVLGRLNESIDETVWVRWEDDAEQNALAISVSDNGFGISPEVAHSLFEQGVSTKEGIFDCGQGLWLVKQFVEGRGGEIWAESVPGESTTFKFTIPYSSSEPFAYYQ